MARNWKNEKLDLNFLVDSGLLFHINQTILHPVGLSLVVKPDEREKLIVCLKDSRGSPESLVFEKRVFEGGLAKLQAFLKEFGYDQMRRRESKLGWACQPATSLERTRGNS